MAVALLLKVGSKGHEVALVQARLLSLGFDPGPVDGDFGPGTETAVRDFQQANGLEVDGVVGRQTLEALGVDQVADNSFGSAALTLVELGHAAERDFGLTVTECSAPGAPARWAPVHPGHSANSLHFSGRAFDTSGPTTAMRAFAAFVDERVGSITELIHNPNGSIKDGKRVAAPTFWGDATWAAHVDHVHVAI
ncbi:MAG: peptidoglycan-binding domain-containing protein [Acidimicrobiales bacterium]